MNEWINKYSLVNSFWNPFDTISHQKWIYYTKIEFFPLLWNRIPFRLFVRQKNQEEGSYAWLPFFCPRLANSRMFIFPVKLANWKLPFKNLMCDKNEMVLFRLIFSFFLVQILRICSDFRTKKRRVAYMRCVLNKVFNYKRDRKQKYIHVQSSKFSNDASFFCLLDGWLTGWLAGWRAMLCANLVCSKCVSASSTPSSKYSGIEAFENKHNK